MWSINIAVIYILLNQSYLQGQTQLCELVDLDNWQKVYNIFKFKIKIL